MSGRLPRKLRRFSVQEVKHRRQQKLFSVAEVLLVILKVRNRLLNQFGASMTPFRLMKVTSNRFRTGSLSLRTSTYSDAKANL